MPKTKSKSYLDMCEESLEIFTEIYLKSTVDDIWIKL